MTNMWKLIKWLWLFTFARQTMHLIQTMHMIERPDWSGSFSQINYIHSPITIITKKPETQSIWTAVWSNEKPLKYNDRNEVRVKASKMSK